MSSDLFGDAAHKAAGAPRLTAWSPQTWSVDAEWGPVLDAFWCSAQGLSLAAFVQSRLDAGAVVYPPHPLRALQITPLSQVKGVILGQDPYHGPHQAQGLSFSVAPGVKWPPSLRNIFKEWQRDLHQPLPTSGSLEAWAKRGVLLLNTSLSVEEGQPASHAHKGWEALTDAVLTEVARTAPACVYMLWGTQAQAKQAMIEQQATAHKREALVLTANHPSPLSALRGPSPFLGCGHFSKAQAWLAQKNRPMDWSL